MEHDYNMNANNAFCRRKVTAEQAGETIAYCVIVTEKGNPVNMGIPTANRKKHAYLGKSSLQNEEIPL